MASDTADKVLAKRGEKKNETIITKSEKRNNTSTVRDLRCKANQVQLTANKQLLRNKASRIAFAQQASRNSFVTQNFIPP